MGTPLPHSARPAAPSQFRPPSRALAAFCTLTTFPPPPCARHPHGQTAADLVLDTFLANGHTTTADALWAGVPVVTLLGPRLGGCERPYGPSVR